MNLFAEWLVLRLLENEETLVSGPGIEMLKHAIEDMISRGAPTEFNLSGFGKTDWNTAMRLSPYLSQKEIPANVATNFLRVLSRYKNTQVGNFEQISSAVTSDIHKTANSSNSQENIEKIQIFNNEPLSYGKVKVFIPHGLDLSEIRSVNKILDSYFESKGEQKKHDDYGNYGYPRFKLFSKDKSNPNIVYIHTNVLNDVIELIKNKRKIEVAGDISSITQNAQGTQDTKANISKELLILGKITNNYGEEKLRVQFNVPFDKHPWSLIKEKGLSPKGASYSIEDSKKGNQGIILINIQDKSLFEKVRDVIASKGIDVQALNDFEKTHFNSSTSTRLPTEEEGKKSHKDIRLIEFFDLPEDKMKIKVDYLHPVLRDDQGKKDFIRELIQYTFPEYVWDKLGRLYTVKGNYQQFVSFGKLLTRFGYNVEELRKVLREKMDSGRIIKDKYHGQHDADSNYAQIEKDIDEQLPESTYELYKQQKEGVAFLYGRHHAILGDETGFGKCIVGNSFIQTSYGIFTIENFWEKFAHNIQKEEKGEWADCPSNTFVHSMDENERIVKKRVTKLYREKINAPIKEIITSNGKKISATIPHKFYTLDGWKSDITTSDYICSSSNQFLLEPNDFNDLKLTELLAWQISEGYENKNRSQVRIFQNDKSVLEKLKSIYDDMKFSNRNTKLPSLSVVRKEKRNNVHELQINCKDYQIFLEKKGYNWGYKSAEKRIPEFIMQSNNEVAKTFLRAYFDAESYVNPNCRQIEISSASKVIIYQLSVLLQRFNILCSFGSRMKMATNGKRIKKMYHMLYVCGSGVNRFFEKIGLDYEYKLRSYYGIKTKPNSNKEGKPVHIYLKPFFAKNKIPFRLINIPSSNYIKGKRWATNKTIEKIISGLEKLESGLAYEEYTNLKKSKWTDKTLDAIQNISLSEIKELISSLTKLKNNDLQYEKVKSIKYLEHNDYVYDLSVEGTHNYIAENIICHNTVQLITAAALRMKKEFHPTLIVSLKSTQQQWIDTIKSVVGEEETKEISTDGSMPKKWTVLYYENFSAGKNLSKVIDACKNANFGIAILDELHKLKHDTSKRSQNISNVLENVNTVWGASATVSANKPMDVKNQLRIVKHHLGKVTDKKFKQDFVGWNEDEDSSLKSAERLNRWLNLSGLYVRRSKDDIREMPALNRTEIKPTTINQDDFTRRYLGKLSGYKNPELPVSRMIAAREVIAQLKTDDTVRKTLGTVSKNMNDSNNNYAASKVVVFTNFIESANQLVSKLTDGLKHINPRFKVITYLASSKKKERSKVKEIFTNDPDAKILVMSMKMGGTGIDFPNAAQNMVINDFDWTPESAEQSEGRIYRINTNHPVNIDYTISNGLDAQLFEKVQTKRKLAAIVQQYRKEYHQKEHDPETLHKIITAQRELSKIDDDMSSIIANNLPYAQKESSFKSFIRSRRLTD